MGTEQGVGSWEKESRDHSPVMRRWRIEKITASVSHRIACLWIQPVYSQQHNFVPLSIVTPSNSTLKTINYKPPIDRHFLNNNIISPVVQGDGTTQRSPPTCTPLKDIQPNSYVTVIPHRIGSHNPLFSGPASSLAHSLIERDGKVDIRSEFWRFQETKRVLSFQESWAKAKWKNRALNCWSPKSSTSISRDFK